MLIRGQGSSDSFVEIGYDREFGRNLVNSFDSSDRNFQGGPKVLAGERISQITSFSDLKFFPVCSFFKYLDKKKPYGAKSR
jgi:hypothetical protein